jgi:site-specific recombinase XerD
MMIKEHKDLFKEYRQEEALRGHTEQGLASTVQGARKVVVYAESIHRRVWEIGLREAQGFQGWLIETGRNDGKPYKEKTIVSYLNCAISFFEFLLRHSRIPANPFKEIRRIRVPKELPKDLLKEDETQRLLDELSRYNEENHLLRMITRYRTHVIAELQYSTGMRISEVAGLKVDDVDCKKGIVHIKGKGKREQTGFLNAYACRVLEIYKKRMRPLLFSELNDKNGELLFGITRQGLGEVVNATLKKVAKQCGYKRFTSHKFRHCMGYHLLRAGCNIRYIQQLLGHKQLKTTEVYTKVDKESLKAVLERCHPRKIKRRTGETIKA